MAEQYGWVAKDKYGDFWYGLFGKFKKDVELEVKELSSSWKERYEFKVVKVKFVEVK